MTRSGLTAPNGTTALGLAFEPLATIPMHNHSPTRGRRRVVEKFTIGEGFWILGTVGVILMGIMLLFLLGYLNADMH
jgi:hypothetical protein